MKIIQKEYYNIKSNLLTFSISRTTLKEQKKGLKNFICKLGNDIYAEFDTLEEAQRCSLNDIELDKYCVAHRIINLEECEDLTQYFIYPFKSVDIWMEYEKIMDSMHLIEVNRKRLTHFLKLLNELGLIKDNNDIRISIIEKELETLKKNGIFVTLVNDFAKLFFNRK